MYTRSALPYLKKIGTMCIMIDMTQVRNLTSLLIYVFLQHFNACFPLIKIKSHQKNSYRVPPHLLELEELEIIAKYDGNYKDTNEQYKLPYWNESFWT